jgi:hypothetical protein
MKEGRVSAVKPNETKTGGDILALLDERMRRIAVEVMSERDEGRKPTVTEALDLVGEQTRLAIQEQIMLSHKTYLTRREAAQYLNVSERSIAEWSARPANQNPFPESHAGGEPRYKRTSIDEWAEREGQRRRLKLAG